MFYQNSENKQRFLEQAVPSLKSYQMSAREAEEHARSYSKKFNIHIVVNGVTPTGKAIIADKLKRLEESKEKNFYRFVHYLQKFFLKRNAYSSDNDRPYVISTTVSNVLTKYYDQIYNAIYKFVDSKTGMVRLNLSEIELSELNNICENLPKEIKSDLKNKMEAYLAQNELLEEVGLSKAQAIEEMKEIQRNCKKGETIGYIFTNNHRRDHFEVFLITKDRIIKPCAWNIPNVDRMITSNDIELMSSAELDLSLVKLAYHDSQRRILTPPSAQADDDACGTMGLLYLKELLKPLERHQHKNHPDQERKHTTQLKRFTMNIPFYDQDGNLKYFFVPSPHVLRYSQSSTYNKVIVAMLNDNIEPENIEYKHEGKQAVATVQTLLKTLMSTKAEADRRGNFIVADQCQKCLEALPKFRKRWLAQYEIIEKKRSTMDKVEESWGEKKTRNKYLTYHTIRLFNKTQSQKDTEKDSEAIQKKRRFT